MTNRGSPLWGRLREGEAAGGVFGGVWGKVSSLGTCARDRPHSSRNSLHR